MKYIHINTEDTVLKTPLLNATENNIVHAVNHLLFHKDIDIKATDKYMCTVFHSGVEGGRIRFLKVLLTHNDVNIYFIDKWGRKARQIA